MNNKKMIFHNKKHDVDYWRNAIVQWVSIIALCINVGCVVLFVFYVHPSDTPLRLQYNVFFGTSLYKTWWYAYMLPLVGLLFFLVDLAVGYVLYSVKERVAGYIVLLGGLLANVALFIAGLSIVLNNYFL